MVVSSFNSTHPITMKTSPCLLLACCVLLSFGSALTAKPLVYKGSSGVGKGKHIVFIASDHEYRGEETCPAIARILAKRYGFKCTVLFGVDNDGHIKPGSSNIPHMEVLKDADMMFLFLRFLCILRQLQLLLLLRGLLLALVQFPQL